MKRRVEKRKEGRAESESKQLAEWIYGKGLFLIERRRNTALYTG